MWNWKGSRKTEVLGFLVLSFLLGFGLLTLFALCAWCGRLDISLIVLAGDF